MTKKLYKILSIDGGGVRGIIPCQLLITLEKKIRERTGNSDACLIDYFDMVAATDFSSIIALLLIIPEEQGSLRPKFSAHDATDIFIDYLPRIFKATFLHKLRTAGGFRDEKYPAQAMEEMLKKYFKELYLSDLLLPCMITAYDVRRRRSMFLTRHDARREPWRDFLLRDACRASASAPTYFETPNITSRSGVHYTCIDGAVVANNPSMCALAEARTHFEVKPDELCILSIGTGIDEKTYYYRDIKDFGAVKWIKPLISFIMSSSSEIADYFCRLAFEGNNVPDNYLRLNLPLIDLPPDMSSEIDDVNPGNLTGLMELGQELGEQEIQRIEKFVDMLVTSQQRTSEEKFKDENVRYDIHTQDIG